MPERPDNAEIAVRIRRAVKMLPPTTREVFLAHLVDDMPYDEIAEQTGFTVREVEQHIARAICAIGRSVNAPRLRRWERWLCWCERRFRR